MKEIIVNSDTYLFIEVPDNALHNRWFVVWDEKNNTFNIEFQTKNDSIYFPLNTENDCYIISTTKDTTEKQAESIVETENSLGEQYYKDYNKTQKSGTYFTAKESLQSLIQYSGLDINKNYLIIIKK